MLEICQALQLCLALVTALPIEQQHARWEWNNPLIVYTSNGPILGHAAPNRSEVTEFLGIPYAEPPVGELRFAGPVKYGGHAFHNASTFGHACPAAVLSSPWHYPNITAQAPRISDYFDEQPVSEQGEDCLSLNVWTKHARYGRRAAQVPVIVVFHGGLFTRGGTNTPFYYGQFWVDAEDIVIVTVGFRANVFGFPNVPGQETQNLGLRDQRLAVEWVRDNIGAFGGDPSRITLLGQSAGAVAVDYWAYSYIDDPIVSGLISQSGDALSFGLGSDSSEPWYNISAQLGCGSSGDTVPCMRQQSWQDIGAAAAQLAAAKTNTPLRSIPAFYPVADNMTVFADYVSRSNAGDFAKLPYLIGNNNFEQVFYQYNVYQKGVITTVEQGDAFLLNSFTCPNAFEAANRRKYKVPTWAFRYFGDWDNLRLYPTCGAYHGSDVDVLFGNDGQVSGIPPSQAEQATTAWMQHTWAAFAADPANALRELGWPEYDQDSDSLARIAYNNNPVPEFVRPSVYDAPCSTVTLAGAATGSS